MLEIQKIPHFISDKISPSTKCRTCSGSGKVVDPKKGECECPSCMGEGTDGWQWNLPADE